MMVLLRLICVLAALALGAGGVVVLTTPPVAAQAPVTPPDYEAWQRTADRADGVIERAVAQSDALETLRAQLVDWRAQFVAAQRINANAITTVQSQLTALGPVPEDGSEEPDIAQSREALNARLSALMAPVRIAELAKSRADGLITGIDKILRERQSQELLELGPSPINPLNWTSALRTLGLTYTALHSEVTAAWHNPIQRTKAGNKLPAVILFGALGLLFVLRGRRWSRGLTNWILRGTPGAGRWIAAFFVSLGVVFIPFLGFISVVFAVRMTGLMGFRGDQMIGASIGPVFVFLLARWLSMRMFPAREARALPLNLDPGQRSAGRLCGASLGLVAASYFFVSDLAGLYNWKAEASNVILFPFIVMGSLLLLRLAGLLQSHRNNQKSQEESENVRTQIARFLALALVILAVVSPALAAIGYYKLAHFLMFPSLLSLQLLAALLVLQRLVVEVYVLITGNREGAAESLVPVLIGMILVLVSLPLFAMIWGARPAKLVEFWNQFQEGLSLGGVTISPMVFLTFGLVFAIGYIATRLLQGTLKTSILPKTRLDQGGRNAIVSGVGYIGIFLAALAAITSAGLDLSSIAIVAGALSVGIGFGLRTIVENFVSGIILLIERPISEGDWIEVGGVHGTVRHISVRSTRIETFDRSDVILPNADLVAGRVTNYTRFSTVGRLIVPVGVAYGNDTRRVEQILRDVAEAHPMVLANPAPAVLFRGFGADSLDFEIRAILRDINWGLSVHSEMNHQIAERFKAEGIEIPFAQRDIWIRNPEAISGMKAPTSPTISRPADTVDELPEVTQDGDGAGDGGDR